MIKKLKGHEWFLVSLLLAVLMAIFRFSHGVIQQDNYIGYATQIPNISSISFYDSRLLPGLPILIYLLHFLTGNYYLAGYLLVFLSFAGSYFLLYKLTKSSFSFLPLVFPPILLNLASLIDTEFPFIFLTILGFYLIKKGRLGLAFLFIGLSVWFRLAGFAVIGGIFVYYLLKKDIKNFLINLPYFAIPVLVLMAFNAHFFGAKNLFYQLFAYEALHPGRISIGIVQLGIDLVRAFRWHWFRILFSGLAYIVLYATLFLKSIKPKSLEFWIITGIYAFTLSVNLVPFLENIGRYLAPTIPFFWILFHSKFSNSKILYLALPLSILAVLA